MMTTQPSLPLKKPQGTKIRSRKPSPRHTDFAVGRHELLNGHVLALETRVEKRDIYVLYLDGTFAPDKQASQIAEHAIAAARLSATGNCVGCGGPSGSPVSLKYAGQCFRDGPIAKAVGIGTGLSERMTIEHMITRGLIFEIFLTRSPDEPLRLAGSSQRLHPTLR